MTSIPFPRRSRRAAFAIVAGLTALTVLASCSDNADTPPTTSGPAKIEFWGFVPGLEDLVQKYNAKNNGTTVEFHRMTGDDSSKVGPAVDAGTGPDIVQLSPLDLPDYVIRNRIVDITGFVQSDQDKYTPSSWSQFVLNGKVWGVPQDIGPRALMYRTDIFQKYGLTVPKTWDDYLAQARKLKAASPGSYFGDIDPTAAGAWKADVIQAQGSWYGTKGDAWTLSLNNAASQTVADRWQTLVSEKLVAIDPGWTPAFWKNVSTGKYATLIAPSWYPVLVEQNIPDTSGKWALAPLPTIGDSKAVGDDGGSGDVVLRGTKFPKQASDFIRWLNSSEETAEPLITKGGLYPASKLGLESPALAKAWPFFGGQKINDIYRDAAANVPPVWVNGPTWGADQASLMDEFAKAFNGKQTFRASLDIGQEAAVKHMKDRGLSVTAG
ncbi:ABC transporter substrate-binding protein [Micromonospora sp. 067-2]|uniref:ABC transporter substrate-binding protein n=1 Tax=Micromonospora sp. 067-2 TaxID=2789270 RepID=UPI003979826F